MLTTQRIKSGAIIGGILILFSVLCEQLHCQNLSTVSMPDNEFTLEWSKSYGLQDSIQTPASSYNVFVRPLQSENFTFIGKSVGYPFADTSYTVNFKNIRHYTGLKFPVGSILIFGVNACLLDTVCSMQATSIDPTAKPVPWVMRIMPNPPNTPHFWKPKRIKF